MANSQPQIDNTSFEWANRTACNWCHVGGGPTEYDRDGYRYDGSLTGHNPNSTTTPVCRSGAAANSTIVPCDNSGLTVQSIWMDGDASTPSTTPMRAGDYTMIGLISGKGPAIQNTKGAWNTGGVAEVDCLFCHLQGKYDNLSRNTAGWQPPLGIGVDPSGATGYGRKYSASLGLVDEGLLTGTYSGTFGPGTNLNTNARTSWSWADIGAGAGVVPADKIGSPTRTACANCHYGDRGVGLDSGLSTKLAALGPSGLRVGFTLYQKRIAAGLANDDDECTTTAQGGCGSTTNLRDGKNDVTWDFTRNRGGNDKRGTSINDPNNPDVHMDNFTHADGTVGKNMLCVRCHYNLEGTFGPVKNAAGTEFMPAVTVTKEEHQFAKGHMLGHGYPFLIDVDQFEGTLSCESCHITGTHPNKGTAPIATHPGLPAIHLDKIDCRTCHLGQRDADGSVTGAIGGRYVRPPLELGVTDNTLGPFRAYGRGFARSNPTDGIVIKPLYTWLRSTSLGGKIKIRPTEVVSIPSWVNGTADDPVFLRRARVAAMTYRVARGDSNNDGVLDFSLNRPHGTGPTAGSAINAAAGTGALVMNTASEIASMVAAMNTANPLGLTNVPAIPDPKVNFYISFFTESHNIGSKKQAAKCIDCHSANGFIFKNNFALWPESNEGMQQACTDASGNAATCSEATKRVLLEVGLINDKGEKTPLDLTAGKGHGEKIRNFITQQEALGFSNEKIAKLTETIGTTKPQARLRVTRVKDNPATTDVDESARGLKVQFTDISLCPSGNCTKTTKVGEMVTTTVCNATTTVTTSEHTFSLAPGVWKGNFCAELSVTDTATGLNSTRTFPITLTKRNTRPTLTNVVVTSTVDRIPTITFTASDDDDASSALQVQVVWGDGTTKTVAGNTGTVTKDTAYANRTKTYNVRLTVIDTKGGRTRVTQAVAITATTP